MTASGGLTLMTVGQDHDRRFIAHNPLNGRNYGLSRTAATLFDDIKAVGLDAAIDRAVVRGGNEQQVRLDYTALVSAGIIFDPDDLAKEPASTPPPNPLFLRFELFDVGPFQPFLAPAARVFASLPVFVFGLAVFLALLWFGFTDGWSIYQLDGGLFSLSALATFAALSPFLKVFHELGHILMATAAVSRVRKCGVFLIGFFPLPFVDCSDSELLDSRWQRIKIALGGVYADLFVAGVAYVTWALAEPGTLRVIMSQVFIFSALNSLLFNLNPLLRLDGYFIMVDLLRRPNFGGDAQKRTSGFLYSLVTLSPKGLAEPVCEVPLMLTYGLASFVYRIVIISTLLWNVAPKYLGVGMALAVWGGLTLLLKPMLDRSLAPNPQLYGKKASDVEGTDASLWKPMLTLFRLALFATFFGLVLWFVRWPLAITAPLLVDQDGHYLTRIDGTGRVLATASAAELGDGGMLYTLENEDLVLDQQLNAIEIAIQQATIAGTAGLDPLVAEEATKRLAALVERAEELARRENDLVGKAAAALRFERVDAVRSGDIVPEGTPLGYALRDSEGVRALAHFTAFFAPFFQSSEASLHVYSPAHPNTDFAVLRLDRARVDFQTDSQDPSVVESGDKDRTFIARTIAEMTYAGRVDDIALFEPFVRVDFGDRALYQHAVIQAQRLWFNFQERRISTQNQMK